MDDQRGPDADGHEPWMDEDVDPAAGRAALWVMGCIVGVVLLVGLITWVLG